MENENEISLVVKKVEELSKAVEGNYATKADVKNLGDAMKALADTHEKATRKSQKNRIFGDMETAKEFMDYLVAGPMNQTKVRQKAGPELQKAFLNADGGNAALGASTIPVRVSDRFTQLMIEGGKARQMHEVVQTNGPIDFPVVDDNMAVGFVDDVTCLPEVNNTMALVRLEPKQVGAIYVATSKILNQSILPLAEIIASGLIRSALRFEDDKVAKANNGPTDGGIRGYAHAVGVPQATAASVDAVTADDLLDLMTLPHESVVDGEFWVNRAVYSHLRGLKNAQGTYHFGVEAGGVPTLFGAKVNVWNRLPAGANAGDLIALYGDPRQAGVIGVGREMRIDVSDQELFSCAKIVWRLLYDFSFVVKSPTAVARLVRA